MRVVRFAVSLAESEFRGKPGWFIGFRVERSS